MIKRNTKEKAFGKFAEVTKRRLHYKSLPPLDLDQRQFLHSMNSLKMESMENDDEISLPTEAVLHQGDELYSSSSLETEVGVVPEDLMKVGDEFDSFKEFEKRLQQYCDLTFTDFVYYSTEHIKYVTPPKGLSPDIKYRRFKLECVHGSKKCRQKSKGIRKVTSQKMGCPVFILVVLEKTRLKLVIKDLNLKGHNHPADEIGYWLNHMDEEAEREICKLLLSFDNKRLARMLVVQRLSEEMGGKVIPPKTIDKFFRKIIHKYTGSQSVKGKELTLKTGTESDNEEEIENETEEIDDTGNDFESESEPIDATCNSHNTATTSPDPTSKAAASKSKSPAKNRSQQNTTSTTENIDKTPREGLSQLTVPPRQPIQPSSKSTITVDHHTQEVLVKCMPQTAQTDPSTVRTSARSTARQYKVPAKYQGFELQQCSVVLNSPRNKSELSRGSKSQLAAGNNSKTLKEEEQQIERRGKRKREENSSASNPEETRSDSVEQSEMSRLLEIEERKLAIQEELLELEKKKAKMVSVHEKLLHQGQRQTVLLEGILQTLDFIKKVQMQNVNKTL